MRPLGEAEYVLAKDVPAGIMGGIVGFADPRAGARVGEVLDSYVNLVGRRFSGIRFMLSRDPDPAFDTVPSRPGPETLRDATFQAGVREIGKRDLVFDCWVYLHQLEDVASLAQTVPDQRFVLDHLGGPILAGSYARRSSEVTERWRSGMESVARCPNVTLKVGGLNMHSLGVPWAERAMPVGSEEFATYWESEVKRNIDLFGPGPLHVRKQLSRRSDQH